MLSPQENAMNTKAFCYLRIDENMLSSKGWEDPRHNVTKVLTDFPPFLLNVFVRCAVLGKIRSHFL